MSIPPRRLLEPTPGEPLSEEERLLAAHLQAVPEPAPLSEAAVQRMARRLQVAPRPWWAGRPMVWLLVVGAPLALAGVWSLRQWLEEPVVSAPIAVQRTASSSAPGQLEAPARLERPEVQPAPGQPPPPAPLPQMRTAVRNRAAAAGGRTNAPSAAAPPGPVVRSRPAPEAAPEAPLVAMLEPAPDPLIEESRLLRSALHQLRSLQAPEAALGVLEEYAQRFPEGQLRAEATLARVDALLLLRRSEEALRQLQGLSASERMRLPRGRELRVLEAELEAELGRCDQALQRLERFAAQEPPLAERALFVRATCEARAQRVDQARALYETLLREHPNGAHAAEARRALGKTP